MLIIKKKENNWGFSYWFYRFGVWLTLYNYTNFPDTLTPTLRTTKVCPRKNVPEAFLTIYANPTICFCFYLWKYGLGFRRRYHSCNARNADVGDQESNDAKLPGLRNILRIACPKHAPGNDSPWVKRWGMMRNRNCRTSADAPMKWASRWRRSIKPGFQYGKHMV